MTRRLALLTIAMWMSIPSGLTAATQVPMRCNSEFLQSSWALLKDARWGFARFEQAAFVVREQDGRTHFVRWPQSWCDRQANYKGSIPTNAVAIVHTHPNRYPAPSDDDAAVARRFGIPVYVVTRTRVSFTTGQEMRVIAAGDWNPELCK